MKSLLLALVASLALAACQSNSNAESKLPTNVPAEENAAPAADTTRPAVDTTRQAQ